MKRIIAVLVSILMLQSTAAFATDTNEISDPAASEVKIAVGLLQSIGVDFSVNGERAEPVSRAKFIQALMAMLLYTGGTAEFSFSDVPKDADFAVEVTNAIKIGAVNDGQLFRPYEALTLGEAYKLAVVSLGFAWKAQVNGGWPGGYSVQAARLKLNRGLTITDADTALDMANAAILLKNIAASDIRIPVVFGENRTKYSQNTQTVLSYYHHLEQIDGILDSDEHTALFDATGGCSEDCITIDGEEYRYSGEYSLGDAVTAYVDTNTKNEIRYLYPDNNKEITLDCSDVSYTDGVITVSETNKQYSIRKAAILYNGQAWEDYLLADHPFTYGTLKLIDNGGNGGYDVVKVEEPRYLYVGSIDTENEIVYDKHADSLHLKDKKLLRASMELDAYSEYPIRKNQLLEVYASHDGETIRITECGNSLSGKLTARSLPENKLEIDGTEYKYVDYFKSNYLSGLVLGKQYQFLLSNRNEIVAMEDASAVFSYGYILAKKYEQFEDNAVLRIFTDQGEFVNYPLADKVRLDAVPTAKSSVFHSVSADQLVSYSANASGEIYMLDTCAAEHGTVSKSDNPENRLKKYDYATNKDTLNYRSTGDFSASFTINSRSVIFEVDADESKSEAQRYAVKTMSSYDNDSDHDVSAITAYNVSKACVAEVLVYCREVSAAVSETAEMAVVESVGQALNVAGDSCSALHVFLFAGTNLRQRRFATLYVREQDRKKLIDDTGLGGGDIVRVNYDSDTLEVKGLSIDYDCSLKKQLKIGSDSGVYWMAKGKVFAIDGSVVCIARPKNDVYDFEDTTLRRLLRASSACVLAYNQDKRKLTTKSIESLLPYTTTGENASEIVARVRYGDCAFIVLYE